MPKLLDTGYRVKVLDLYLYGEDVLDESLDSKLKDKIQEYGLDRSTDITRQVVEAQQQLWEVTMNNLQILREVIGCGSRV